MSLGFADLHNHQFANLAFGGRLVWGDAAKQAATALAPCTPLHGRLGHRDVVGAALRLTRHGRFPLHRPTGHPCYNGWPRWDTYTHQGMHVDWLRRAVDGGLRLMVMHAVNNAWVGTRLLGLSARDASDMVAVDRQLQAAWDLQHLVDRAHGGPGQGWYRIVLDPAEARQVIADGKLAVVLGIEVDTLFGADAGTAMTSAQLRRELDRYVACGVRHIFPVHFGDNGFGGGAFDNPMIRDADARRVSRRNPLGTVGAFPVHTEDGRASGYAYRTGRRNRAGLTPLGRTLVHELVERGLIIDINHMSERTKRDTLDICARREHPVIAGHTGFLEVAQGDRRHEGQLTRTELSRIVDLGGMVGVIIDQGNAKEIASWRLHGQPPIPIDRGGTSASLVQAYLYAVDRSCGAPVGLGTDFNGFARLPGPRRSNRDRVSYPYRTAAGDRLLHRSQVGPHALDLNRDGLAHVGMLPDLIADFQAMGITDSTLAPLLRSADGYVDVWSRAKG